MGVPVFARNLLMVKNLSYIYNPAHIFKGSSCFRQHLLTIKNTFPTPHTFPKGVPVFTSKLLTVKNLRYNQVYISKGLSSPTS